MKILYVYGDQPQEWNCSEHRIAVPFRAMRRAGVECEMISFEQAAQSYKATAIDALWMQLIEELTQ
jgi:hypothetical protein